MNEPLIAYIGVGSNMGDREAYCRRALRRIGRFQRTSLTAESPWYETAPMEREGQDWFINGVVAVRTTLSPPALLRACQEVEQSLGRKRTVRYGPRTMDLDLLFYGDRVIQNPDITIPHPKAHERRFVLQPLSDIAPDLMHPILQKTVRELLLSLGDDQVVRAWKPVPARRRAES